MAKFVKDDVVKGETPNYSAYARKIDVPNFPQMDTWKGLAGMLETVATIPASLDRSIKADIDQTMQQRTQALQDSEINRLEGQLGTNTTDIQTNDPNQAQNQAQDPNSPVNARVWGPTGGTGGDNPEIVPPDNIAANIDRGIAKVERFKNAADQGKEPNHYSARALAEWRNIRKDIPMKYRGYADAKMSSYLGFDPANKYIADLNTQLKSLQTQKDDRKNKTLGYLDDLKKEAPEAASVYNKVLNNQMTPEQGMAAAESMYKPIIEANMAKRQWETVQNKDAVANWTATDSLDKIIAAKHSTFASGAVNTLGLDMSPNDIRRKLIDVQAGKDKATQEQLTQWGHSMQAYTQNLQMQLEAEANKANASGLSYRGILGDDVVNKKIADAVKPYADISKSLLGNDYDMAQFVLKGMKDRETDAGRKLLDDPQLGDPINLVNAMKVATGNNQAFQSIIGPALLEQSGIVGGLRNYVTRKTLSGGMQTTVPSKDGSPITISGAIDHMYKSGVPVPTGAAMAIEQLNQFSDPNLPKEYKQGLVMYYYHPQNMGLLQKFNKEQKGHVFNMLTSPGVIDQAWEATKDRKDLQDHIVNWARHSFGVEFMTTEIKDLNGVTMPEGVNVSFDPKTSHLKVMHRGIDVTNSSLLPGTARPAFRVPREDSTNPAGYTEQYTPGLQAVKNPVMRINQAIDNVKHIAKKTGEDPNVWLVDALRTAGLNVDFNRITADPNLVNPPKKGAK